MGAEDAPEETKVSDRGMVTIPAAIRRRLDIDAGDTLRWDTDGEGSLTVEGVFDDFEPIDVGETNAVEIENEFGSE